MRRRVCRVLANGPGRWEVPVFLHVWVSSYQAHICAQRVAHPLRAFSNASAGIATPFRKFWCPIPFTEFLGARGTVVLTEYLAAGDGALEVP